jgi:hypothetical protein
MSEVERLRNKTEKCRQLALMAGNAEIERRRLVALADEFEAKTVRAGAQANCKRDRLAQVAENPDEHKRSACGVSHRQ